jgi:hypothetical protein
LRDLLFFSNGIRALESSLRDLLFFSNGEAFCLFGEVSGRAVKKKEKKKAEKESKKKNKKKETKEQTGNLPFVYKRAHLVHWSRKSIRCRAPLSFETDGEIHSIIPSLNLIYLIQFDGRNKMSYFL